jgi:hypothetical protein
MKHARLGQLAALGAVVALVLPVTAQANEVTKWNEIVVNTINAPTQPAIVSAPPAGAVFVAMVQGAVYGAVNESVDRCSSSDCGLQGALRAVPVGGAGHRVCRLA